MCMDEVARYGPEHDVKLLTRGPRLLCFVVAFSQSDVSFAARPCSKIP